MSPIKGVKKGVTVPERLFILVFHLWRWFSIFAYLAKRLKVGKILRHHDLPAHFEFLHCAYVGFMQYKEFGAQPAPE